MQALYQLSYSPLLGPPGFPPAATPTLHGPPGGTPNRFRRPRAGPTASSGDEGVEPLERAVLLQEAAVDRLALQLAVRLDRVALYDQRPRAFLAPVLVVGVDRLHVADDRRTAAAPVALSPVCTHRSAPAVAAGRALVGDSAVVAE